MILVVNLGLKSIRCIAFSYAGRVVGQISEPIHTMVSNEFVEQDPRVWDDLMASVVGEVVASLGTAASKIEYLTVTTSASCLVPVDSEGPVRNCILVSDTRSVEEVQILAELSEFAPVRDTTGLKPSPDLMLPKIMWLVKHEPETADRTLYFLGAGDYLIWRLTGETVTDPSNALKFHYLLGESGYPVELMGALGLSSDSLPAVLPMGSDVGPLKPALADALGIPRTCRVILSTYDALAAVTGTGAFDVGDAVDVSGTVTSFRVVTDKEIYDPQGRIYVSPHLEGTSLVGGSNNLGGGMVEWLRQLFFSDSEDPYREIEAEASGQPPCPGGLIFLPYLLGERAPIWNPDCRGVFFGLNRAHRRPEMVRSVLESIGMSVRDIAEVLRSFSVEIDSVTVSGGLARLDSANQIKADILGLPIRRVANFETTSIGAALIALAGAGVIADPVDGFQDFCAIDREYEPDEMNHTIYNEYFLLYREVYESLVPAFAHRKQLLDRLQPFGVDELVLTENL
jgi:xylulokinase